MVVMVICLIRVQGNAGVSGYGLNAAPIVHLSCTTQVYRGGYPKGTRIKKQIEIDFKQ